MTKMVTHFQMGERVLAGPGMWTSGLDRNMLLCYCVAWITCTSSPPLYIYRHASIPRVILFKIYLGYMDNIELYIYNVIFV
jgi:hypothetical protein